MADQIPVYIKDIGIVDYRCFSGENKFSFVDENGNWCRWTVFLGDNNTGKTNLLKAIASMEPELESNLHVFAPIGISPIDRLQIGTTVGITTNRSLKNKSGYDLHWTIHKEKKIRLMGSTNEQWKHFSIYAYGVIRDIERKGFISNGSESTNTDNLFQNSKLINFEDWLFQLDYAARNENAPMENQVKAAARRNLLKSVLTSEIFPEISDLHFISDADLNNYIEFQTKDGWHKLSELGYGYQATLSWMVDFCKKLFDRYPSSENPLKEPAVLLVDEIDLHLHPQWQRSIIKYLSNIFTQTQFIVTTHSPFILQSMENVNLYGLQREGDHTKVQHFGIRSFIGWRIEEILSEIMGLENNIHTETYQDSMKQFEKAIEAEDYKSGKAAYDKLMQILHPQSEERKLLDIQLSQLLPNDQA